LAGVIFDNAKQEEPAEGPWVECPRARAAYAGNRDPGEEAAPKNTPTPPIAPPPTGLRNPWVQAFEIDRIGCNT